MCLYCPVRKKCRTSLFFVRFGTETELKTGWESARGAKAKQRKKKKASKTATKVCSAKISFNWKFSFVLKSIRNEVVPLGATNRISTPSQPRDLKPRIYATVNLLLLRASAKCWLSLTFNRRKWRRHFSSARPELVFGSMNRSADKSKCDNSQLNIEIIPQFFNQTKGEHNERTQNENANGIDCWTFFDT